MEMEFVEQQLKEWGEIIVITAAGSQFELHLGDTTFDLENRVIHLQTRDAQYVIDGDSVESITKHYGGKEN